MVVVVLVVMVVELFGDDMVSGRGGGICEGCVVMCVCV